MHFASTQHCARQQHTAAHNEPALLRAQPTTQQPTADGRFAEALALPDPQFSRCDGYGNAVGVHVRGTSGRGFQGDAHKLRLRIGFWLLCCCCALLYEPVYTLCDSILSANSQGNKQSALVHAYNKESADFSVHIYKLRRLLDHT